MKNCMASNSYIVIINSFRLLKTYLICDYRRRYRNWYNLIDGIWKYITNPYIINYQFWCIRKFDNKIWKLIISKYFHNYKGNMNTTNHPLLYQLSKEQKENGVS